MTGLRLPAPRIGSRPGTTATSTDVPDVAVLTEAGFAIVGDYDFPTPYEWTVERLTGFLYSTSVLSKPALGAHAPAFEQDLPRPAPRGRAGNVLRETIDNVYTLARVG